MPTKKPPARERHPSQARRVTTTDLSADEIASVDAAAEQARVSRSRWVADAARERLRGEVDR